MRIFFASTAAIALLSTAVFAGDGLTTFQRRWKSDRYVQQPFPNEWRPPNIPPTERNLGAYQAYEPARRLSIREVVSRFGIPDRYLGKSSPDRIDSHWLIYDLPDGSAVGFYIPLHHPDSWAVGVIIDSRGRELRTIR